MKKLEKRYFCTASYFVISDSFTSKNNFTYFIICNNMNCVVTIKKLKASK